MLLSGFQPVSNLSPLAFKADENLFAVHDSGNLARPSRIGQHGLELFAVVDNIDIVYLAALCCIRFPSGARERSLLLAEYHHVGL